MATSARVEEWRSPNGKVLQSDESVESTHPDGLVWRKRIKLLFLGGLALFLLTLPITGKFLVARPPESTVNPTAAGGFPGGGQESSSLSSLQSVSAFTVVTPTNTPRPTFTPTLTPVPSVYISASDCLIFGFPAFDSPPVASLAPASVVEPSGYWVDVFEDIWYRTSDGWVSPLCWDNPSPGVLPFISPPVRKLTPTFTPVPLPTETATARPPVVRALDRVIPTAAATATARPRWAFEALPVGFNPGWCVKVAARSVWLPDGSRYDANDGFVYLSDGVLRLDFAGKSGYN